MGVFMRRVIIAMVTILISGAAFFFNACTTDEKENERALTQDQADAAIQANAATIVGLVNLVSFHARSAATTGNVTSLEIDENDYFGLVFEFGKYNTNGLPRTSEEAFAKDGDEFFYDGNGCWSIDYDTTDVLTDLGISILAQICFDIWNELGGPTENTTKMTYIIDFGMNGSLSRDQESASYNIGVDRNLTVGGISDYNANIGRLSLTGTIDESFDLTMTGPNGTQSITIDYSYNVKSVEIHHGYPQLGNIDFSIGLNADPVILDFPNFTINGSIGFNGSEIVGISFDGYNYSLNLTTGQIS
jgi:hypothetical protein